MSKRKNRSRKKNTSADAPGSLGRISSHWFGIGILILSGIIWHGYLLTNDGTIWDSWFVQSWLVNKNWPALNEFFGSVGMPVYAWLYAPFAFAPDIVFAFMVATVGCLLAQTILIYFLAIRLGGLNSQESFCIALLAQATPVFTAGQDFIMFFFVFMNTLFLLAALVTTRALEFSGWRQIVLRVAAILMFFVSFYNAALLVIYGGFFLLLFFKWRLENPMKLWASAWKFGCTHADLLFLPPVSWFLRNRLTPQYGWYETYNNPAENISLILPSLQSFFVNVLPFHVKQLGEWIGAHPVIIGALVIGVVATALRGPRLLAVARSRTGFLSLICFGILLLFFAIFPFAAAGKGFSPRPIGEPSRYTSLTGLPLAIILFASLRALLLPKPGTTSRWFAPICVGIAIVLGCQIPPVYVAERAEWVFNKSVLTNVANNEEVRKSSVVVFQNFGMTNEIVYGIYAFASVFGDTSRLVTNQVPQNRQFFTPSEIEMTLLRTSMLPNFLNQVNPAGQQLLLVATRNRGGLNDFQIAQKYLMLRLFGTSAEMKSFLSNLTTLQTGVLKTSTPLLSGLVGLDPPEPGPAGGKFTNTFGIEMMPITGGWWAAKYETTQKQYERVIGVNPSLFRDPLRPVERVSWHEAVEFCTQLTCVERKAGRVPNGFEYRLPTTKEFEILSANTPLSDAVIASSELHWHTQPVGSLSPNPNGLYDVIGNVWEWTLDWAEKGKYQKLCAGGSFVNFPAELALHPRRGEFMDFFSRTMVNLYFGPTRRDYPDQSFWDRGFRVVLAKEVDLIKP